MAVEAAFVGTSNKLVELSPYDLHRQVAIPHDQLMDPAVKPGFLAHMLTRKEFDCGNDFWLLLTNDGIFVLSDSDFQRRYCKAWQTVTSGELYEVALKLMAVVCQRLT